MKLSARMLCEAMREITDVDLIGESKTQRNLRFPCFYDGNPDHLMAGGVYLVERGMLPRGDVSQHDVLFVCWTPEPPKPVDFCPILHFKQEDQPQRILNLLQQTFVRFCSWEEQLDQILHSGSSIQKMIELSEPMIAHPLCVMDASSNYLGYSTSFVKKEEALQNAPVLLYDRAQDLAIPLKNQDYTLGTAYLLHTDQPFTETERLLFGILAEKFAAALMNLSLLSGLYRNGFKLTLQQLFRTRQVEAEQLYDSLTQWGGQQGDTFLCYKVKASHINEKINAEYICGIFEHVLEGSVAFWHDEVLVVLVDLTRHGTQEEALHRKTVDLLRQLHMKAGVSLPFTELMKAFCYFRQACCAFEEGYPVSSEETLYFFQNYVPSYILHHAAGEFAPSFLLDQGMLRLLEHDKLYSISYRETLDAYFRCQMNMSQTAQLLKIHRTSLNSRMQKIRELLDHPMTQEYLLYLQIVLAILKNNRATL